MVRPRGVRPQMNIDRQSDFGGRGGGGKLGVGFFLLLFCPQTIGSTIVVVVVVVVVVVANSGIFDFGKPTGRQHMHAHAGTRFAHDRWSCFHWFVDQTIVDRQVRDQCFDIFVVPFGPAPASWVAVSPVRLLQPIATGAVATGVATRAALWVRHNQNVFRVFHPGTSQTNFSRGILLHMVHVPQL